MRAAPRARRSRTNCPDQHVPCAAIGPIYARRPCRSGSVLGTAGCQPCVSLAHLHCASGQPPRLRHRRLRLHQSGAGRSAGLATARGALAHPQLGVVLDVVPNHMAADPVHNALWRQVLREGPSSPAASFFDIDWRPLTGLVRDKVLLPLLEEPYGQALMKGVVQVEPGAGGLHIRCGASAAALPAPRLAARA